LAGCTEENHKYFSQDTKYSGKRFKLGTPEYSSAAAAVHPATESSNYRVGK
jgi:hypothetical protein